MFSFSKSDKVLVVAPHPDDESLGAWGLLQRIFANAIPVRIVFATSGESGNSSRDEKMHKEVLESGKYPEVVFRPSQVEGKVANSGSSDVKVHGTFVLHGGSHDITVPVHAELNGGSWKGSGKLDVPYIQWGLKNPSNFLLKVQPVVNVQLEITGALHGQE